MNIDLQKLQYTFKKKPLLVGGKAMEYYHLRKAGSDIDFVASEEDFVALLKQYPNRVKNIWGDLGVCPYEFEMWRSINFVTYEQMKKNAMEEKDFLVVSLEQLLYMKMLAFKKEKYLEDSKLIVEEILRQKYEEYTKEQLYNEMLLEGIKGIKYIEKTGSSE